RSVQMDNLKAAKFNQLLMVTCCISELKKASLTFDQTIFIASASQPLAQTICTGRFKVACVDLSKMKPVKIPAKIIEVLNSVT
ncbi:MAG: acyl-CoA thioester hydrolase, partial [Alteromonadaceae bacterium]